MRASEDGNFTADEQHPPAYEDKVLRAWIKQPGLINNVTLTEAEFEQDFLAWMARHRCQLVHTDGINTFDSGKDVAPERINQALDIAVKWIQSEVAYWHTTGCQGTDWENDVNAMLSKINQLRTLPATNNDNTLVYSNRTLRSHDDARKLRIEIIAKEMADESRLGYAWIDRPEYFRDFWRRKAAIALSVIERSEPPPQWQSFNIKPADAGWYRVLISGDNEYGGGPYQTWMHITIDEEGLPEGAGVHDEILDDVLAWFGPIAIPEPPQ